MASIIRSNANARPEQVRARVCEIFHRYVDPNLRAGLEQPDDQLQLGADLGLDSLTLMEIVLRLEDAFGISITDDQLRHFRTLAEVRHSIEHALERDGASGMARDHSAV